MAVIVLLVTACAPRRPVDAPDPSLELDCPGVRVVKVTNFSPWLVEVYPDWVRTRPSPSLIGIVASRQAKEFELGDSVAVRPWADRPPEGAPRAGTGSGTSDLAAYPPGVQVNYFCRQGSRAVPHLGRPLAIPLVSVSGQ